MSFDSAANNRNSNASRKKTHPLSLEHLEARMLMAFNVVEAQLGDLLGPSVVSNSAVPTPANLQASKPTLSSLAIRSEDGTIITAGRLVQTSASSIRVQVGGLDKLGRTLASVPKTSWIISSENQQAKASVSLSGNAATLSFNRPADYQITVKSGKFSHRFTVRFSSTVPTALGIFNSNGGQRIEDNGSISVANASHSFSVSGIGSSGQLLSLSGQTNWLVETSPQGSSASFRTQNVQTTVTFDRVGQYVIRATNGSLSSRVRINVVATLTSISVAPGTNSVSAGASLQLQAQGLDQFGRPLEQQPNFSWTATGGTISSSGLFSAGSSTGNFAATARSGSLSGSAAVRIIAAAPQGGDQFNGLTDPAIRSLTTTYYADSSISRSEMLDILRSTAADNIVTTAELADLRYLVSTTSTIQMPEYVRGLAKNVVNNNPANLRFRGQTAGNLVAGSSGSLLTKLVDKWFLGADLPGLTSSSISYRTAVGSLFVNSPTITDSRQGMLGDCYFLASLVSIAERNQDTIRNMFVDNGDGTFTVRFYGGSLGMFWQGGLISAGFVSGSGVADYVTVDRNLPTYSNGGLAYSGYGRSALSTSTPLWLALAEKAYAQWNETGKSGRDGSNSYAAIEGGWMSNVNAQVLGNNSTYYSVSSSSKQAMINALNSGQAVTIGTNSNASTGGLVGSHAYIVTGYNATGDNFTLYNPWSTQHPTPLTWTQMQGQTSAFVIANPTGSVSGGQPIVRSQASTIATTMAPAVELVRQVQHCEPVYSDQVFAQHVEQLLEPELDFADGVTQNISVPTTLAQLEQIDILPVTSSDSQAHRLASLLAVITLIVAEV